MSHRVVTMGYAAMDHLFVVDSYPDRGSKCRILQSVSATGGQAVTAASALSRWGIRVRCIARIGDDPDASRIREDLDRDAIPLDSILSTCGARTQKASICVDRRNGERTIFWERDPELNLGIGDLRHEWFRGVEWLMIDGHEAEADILACDWVKADGGRILLDAETIGDAHESLLKRVDACIASSDFGLNEFGVSDPEQTLDRLRGYSIPIVAVTLGKDGAICDVAGDRFRVPGVQVAAVDTTGAGDIFHAGFIYGMLHHFSPRTCFELANRAAALSCRFLGGRHGIPLTEEFVPETLG